ncbi:MAG: sigma-54-dependent Fis family transcriptional regulator [Myxococcales bacterium]|nr:sigma-54-dependent Fis family transcriptional regulator [Myxococcales bacterium]
MDPSSAHVYDFPTERSYARQLSSIVGASPAIRALRENIVQYAPSLATVVIHGESGTGKELVARALHACSARRERRFVAASVAEFCPELLGSELFGHARGAFTGALTAHRGLFEQAHESTLFLDEIGELSLAAQAALLRVLETGDVRPVGAECPKHVRVRLVVATHRDLAAMVREGSFRSDLFYRLHVLVLHVPALRERAEDVSALVASLLERLRVEIGTRTLCARAVELLARQPWPGNVRQLMNVLRRAAASSSSSEIGVDAIARALDVEPVLDEGFTSTGATEKAPKPVLTEASIRRALADSAGKIAPAARQLGIARSTFRDHLHRFGIVRP